MIKLKDASPTTRQFLGDVSAIVFDAADLGGRRAKTALAEIADHVTNRRIDQLSDVDPAQVELTDEQWANLTKQVRISGGGPAGQW